MSEQNLPTPGSVWGVPDQPETWIQIERVSEIAGQWFVNVHGFDGYRHILTAIFPPENHVDITAMVTARPSRWKPIAELQAATIYAGDRIAVLMEYRERSDGPLAKHVVMMTAEESGWRCDDNPGASPEDGEAWVLERELIGITDASLNEPFTVDWLVEIGGRPSAAGVVTFEANGDELQLLVCSGNWFLNSRGISTQITTKRDVLKWLDVLGIQPTKTGQ